jgi:hypothetical protein
MPKWDVLDMGHEDTHELIDKETFRDLVSKQRSALDGLMMARGIQYWLRKEGCQELTWEQLNVIMAILWKH